MSTELIRIDIRQLLKGPQQIRTNFQEFGNVSRIPDGCYAGIDNTGEIRVIISYSNGMAHGKYCDYSKSGQLMTEGAYRFGHQEGEWRFYHRDGTLFDIIFFRNGIEIQSLGHLLAGKFVDQLSEEMIDAILHEKPDDKNEKND